MAESGYRQSQTSAVLLLILFFAYYFMKYEEKINTVRVIVPSFVLLAIPLFLI